MHNTITFTIEKDSVIRFLKGEAVQFYGNTLGELSNISFTYNIDDVKVLLVDSLTRTYYVISLVKRESFRMGPS